MTSFYPNNYSFGNQGQYHRKKSEDDTPKFAIGAAGLGVATVGIRRASEFLAQKLMQGQEFTTFENVQKVADDMLETNKLNGVVQVGYLDKSNVDTFIRNNDERLAGSLHVVAEGKNAFFTEAANPQLAVAPKSKPSLMLHELGHAINAHNGGIMKILQKTRGLSAYAPAAIALMAPFFQSKKDEKTNFVKDNAGLLGFAAFLPTIIEEGMASLRGIKAAAKKLPGVDLKHLKRNYALAWGTYVLAGVGLGLGAKMAVVEQNN